MSEKVNNIMPFEEGSPPPIPFEMTKEYANKLAEKGLEQQKGEPKLNVLFSFAPHGSPRDADLTIKGIADRNIDVFIPEVKGWESEYLEKFRLISDGKAKVEDVFNLRDLDDIEIRVLRELKGKKKLVYFIDVPDDVIEEENGISELEKQADVLFEKAANQAWLCNFEESGSCGRRAIDLDTEANLLRENYMLTELAKLKGKIIKDAKAHSDLQDKDQLNILITLGSFHLSMYPELKKRDKNQNEAEPFATIGKQIKDIFYGVPYLPYRYGFLGLRREKSLHLTELIKDEDIVRAIIEQQVEGLIFVGTGADDFPRAAAVSLFLVSQLNDEEIKDIFKRNRTGYNNRFYDEEAASYWDIERKIQEDTMVRALLMKSKIKDLRLLFPKDRHNPSECKKASEIANDLYSRIQERELRIRSRSSQKE